MLAHLAAATAYYLHKTDRNCGSWPEIARCNCRFSPKWSIVEIFHLILDTNSFAEISGIGMDSLLNTIKFSLLFLNFLSSLQENTGIEVSLDLMQVLVPVVLSVIFFFRPNKTNNKEK